MSSRSFMDAIRSVARAGSLTEGAKDKTSDGMTKDAKHFAQDLHKVTDPGMKHLVQKDSETKDYDRMFKGGVDKFPTRLADMEPSQSVDKYVEYNESVDEAKKMKKKDDDRPSDSSDSEDSAGSLTSGPMESKHPKGCDCKECKSVKEAWYNPFSWPTVGPAGAAGKAKPVGDKGQAGRVSTFKAPPAQQPAGARWGAQAAARIAPQPAPQAAAPKAAAPVSPTTGAGRPAPSVGTNKPSAVSPQARAISQTSKMSGGGTMSPNSQQVAASQAKNQTSQMSGSTMGSKTVPKPNIKPARAAKPAAAKPAAAKPASAKPSAAKPRVAKPQVAKPVAAKPAGTPASRLQSKTQRDAIAGPSHLRQSYDIEWNGKSYVLDESAIQAMNAFIEKYGIEEGTAGEFIHKEMQHPEKLTAKGKKQKIKQSLAIYYSKKRRGENP